MMKLSKFFTFLFVLSVCFALTAQQYEANPNAGPVSYYPPIEAMWDLLLEFDAAALSGAAGNAGAEWDGTSFYSTRWASNLIHEYSADGTTLIRQFSIPGVSGLRDLAYDGTYFYGGASSTTIYQMDFATSTLIGTIPTTEAVRHIAYDSDLDAFYVGNWSTDIVLIDRSGNELSRIPADPVVTSNYGSCYDNVNPGGPYLWVFSQGAGAGTPQNIHQLQLPGGVATGVAHDVLGDITGASGTLSIAGGLFSMTDYETGLFTIGGLLQGNPIGDIIFVYDAAAGAPCPVGQATNPNPVNGATGVDINLAAISWTNGTSTPPTQIEVWFDGAIVYTGTPVTSYTIPGPLAYATSYNWQVNGSDGTCWTNGPIWTFTTMDDPSITGTWSSGTVMPDNTYLGAGVALNGFVYSVGGNTNSGLNEECYKYEVATDTWTTIASLPVGKVVHYVATGGNYVYAIGGSSSASGAYTDTCYQYDPIGDTWTQVASLPVPIGWPQAVGYNGTHIYVAGGHDGVNPLASVYVYDVIADTWATATSMPGERFGGAFSVTGNQLVYVSGIDLVNFNDSVYVGTIDGVDPTIITWVNAASLFPGNKDKDRSTYGGDITGLSVVDKRHVPVLPEAVYPPGGTYKFGGAAPWGTDGIIVAGGNDGVGGYWTATDHCYVYNPTTDTWSAELPLPIGVLGASSGSVNTGDIWKFVVASGYTGSSITDATQIYTVDFGGGSTTFPLAVLVDAGWNMVSTPGLHPVNQNVTTWWPNLVGSVFGFSGGYVSTATAAVNEGYWMKNSVAETYNYPAIDIVTHAPITVAAGWNMIGGNENSAPVIGLTTTPPGLIVGSVFGYSGGYVTATDLVPGYGYWIKVTGDGVIDPLPAPLSKGSTEVVEYIQDDWGKITITDNAGRSYTLYAVNGEVDLDNYELPPVPPSGMFDIRFGSDRIAEDINSSIQSIEMSGIEHPVRVTVENMSITLQDESGNNINAQLKPGEVITINNSSISKLLIISGEIGVPIEYALEQNYPNPFNPSTVIEFSLPEDVSNVQLTIYDVLGQRITQLVNTSLKAGRYSYQWNAGTVATGMYIYELRANSATGGFVSVKKMILMK